MSEVKALNQMDEQELLLRAAECWHMAVEHIREGDLRAAKRAVQMAGLYSEQYKRRAGIEGGGAE